MLSSQEGLSSLCPAPLGPACSRVLRSQGESGHERMRSRVEGSVLWPWKTWGLVGLGPKAQQHSQKEVGKLLPSDSAWEERRRRCALEMTLLEKRKKNYPRANLDFFPIGEMFDHVPYKGQPHWPTPVVRAASQHRMLLKLDYRPLIRIQLALLYINKIRTLERIMLCEFQMDCDNRPVFSVVVGSCQMGPGWTGLLS